MNEVPHSPAFSWLVVLRCQCPLLSFLVLMLLSLLGLVHSGSLLLGKIPSLLGFVLSSFLLAFVLLCSLLLHLVLSSSLLGLVLS